ncbi:MAG: hypothetical protein JWO11_2001 [Nocardioides sp.]|nr:hypothetical protein [Nocardioides sp.]
MSAWGVRRAVAGALALLALGVTATGCGSASESSPPTGVDGLVIPTPSPDPHDFVSGVDNPWTPLTPGTVLDYDLGGVEGAGRLTLTVGDGTRVVAGIETTEVTSTSRGPDAETHTDYYAQDRAGNVWWFGRAGDWQAGVDGAEAGLAMPAAARVGDGFRLGFLDGVVEDRAEVVAVDATVDTSGGPWDQLVVLAVSSDLHPGTVQRRYYARGVGLVYAENVEGPDLSQTLTRGPDDQG